MANLEQLIPDVEVLLALAPEDLAPYLFEVAKGQLQNGMFAPGNLVLSSAQLNPAAYRNSPWDGRTKEIELATAEAWNWLRVQGLVVPASGINGQHGFLVISRRGQSIKSTGDFHRFKDAAAFPKSLLHPAIADKVWLDVVRGDLADAVFTAFRAVEEATEFFLEGDVLGITVRHGRWVLTHRPAGPRPAPPPAQHYFPAEE